ncbi:hypothetical protein OVS_03490 [Mycoplasma ovis str. Michigan]|uniref:Uncharacterized protein n=1 Tax=Mycoplasma ovis str. Michigan TaxID=1415773 RepID=A0ABN4BNI4_9MOLU|nr:hypothetical protein [Mycoplasma ovis]AHC40447.1 hypothetical protein OVS_03490 [Mycoplasma ovis str. Michigan]
MSIDLSDILFSFSKNKDHYYTISCTESADEDLSSSTAWTGLFPNNLFINRSKLTECSKLEMRIKITPLEGDVNNSSKLTFESNKFSSSVVGEWTGEEQKTKTNTVKVINITNAKTSLDKIFLSFN